MTMLPMANITAAHDVPGSGRRPQIRMADVAPFFSPNGFRAAQQALLDSFAHNAKITQAHWRGPRDVEILRVGLAGDHSCGRWFGFYPGRTRDPESGYPRWIGKELNGLATKT